MVRYVLDGKWYTVTELAEMSGIKPHTIRDRLRRGYSTTEAVKIVSTYDDVKAFNEASCWEDWIGMSINDLHEIYWRWCIQHGYSPLQKQGFSRQIMSMYPNLKIVPTKRGDKYFRVIRKR